MFLSYLVRMQDIPHGINVDVGRALEILRPVTKGRASQAKRLTDSEFSNLLTEAGRWIRELAPIILPFAVELRRYRSKTLARIVANGLEPRGFSYRSYLKTHAPVILRYGEVEINVAAENIKKFRAVQTALTGACYVIIAGGTGMRVTEMLDIMKHSLRRVRLRDGRVLLKLRSVLNKTSSSPDGEPAEWVCGWDEVDNPIRLAVDILEKLYPKSPYLFAGLGQRLNDDDKRITPSTAAYCVRLFVKMSGIKLASPLQTHQFRRAFARFVAYSNPAGMAALRRQFKHISALMTERYLPDDPELIDDIVAASLEIAEEHYESILKTPELSGLKGREILSRRPSYKGALGAAQIAEAVRLALLDPSIRPVFHIYGVCLFDDPDALCGGMIEEIGIDLCVSCKNLVVERQHLPIWIENRDGLISIVEHLDSLGVRNEHIEKQLKRSRNIIADFKGVVDNNARDKRRSSATKKGLGKASKGGHRKTR